MSVLQGYLGTHQHFIKICGVTRSEDALLCSQLGVSAIGILVEQPNTTKKPGSCRMSLGDAAELVASLPVGLLPIMLVHTTDLPTIVAQCERVRPRALQIQVALHITELTSLKNQRPDLTILKTFRIAKETTLEAVLADINAHVNAGAIDVVLLDAAKPGHGIAFDWSLAAALGKQLPGLPIVLAGGLKPDNVRSAIEQVRPCGVDVMSAVKSLEPDKKDHEAIRSFVRAVRSAGGSNV
jgi:phosphoribosylanthranilate isomerase